jgi:dephospho-CoA kinase
MTKQKPVIGLIGGIGSGKSTVAEALARRGGAIVAGDPVGHEALRQPEIKQIIAAQWPTVLDSDGEVNRKTLGRIVFADRHQLTDLESLVFPWIKNRLRQLIAAAQADANVRFVILDAAVMLEAGWNDVCDRLIFIDVPTETRVARVAQRGWSKEELLRREASQMSLDEKRRRADVVLDNSGSVAEMQGAVDRILRGWELLPKET